MLDCDLCLLHADAVLVGGAAAPQFGAADAQGLVRPGSKKIAAGRIVKWGTATIPDQ